MTVPRGTAHYRATRPDTTQARPTTCACGRDLVFTIERLTGVVQTSCPAGCVAERSARAPVPAVGAIDIVVQRRQPGPRRARVAPPPAPLEDAPPGTPRPPRPCADCGGLLPADRTPHQRYCTPCRGLRDQHSRREAHRRRRQRGDAPAAGACRTCGVTLPATGKRGRPRRYCEAHRSAAARHYHAMRQRRVAA
jgi:hypothetical protein